MTRQLRSTHLRTTLAFVLIALTVFTGCHPTQPFYFHEDGDLSHYLDHATAIEEPDYSQPHLEDVEYAEAPLTISNPEFREMWDLSLEEVVSISLQNSKVIRGIGSLPQFSQQQGQTNDTVLRGGGASIYDTALVESDPRNGVEAALAEFDAQLTILGTEGSDGFDVGTSGQGIAVNRDRPQNVAAAPINNSATGGVEIGIAKKTASGTTLRAASHTDRIQGNPIFGTVHNTVWEQYFEVSAVHPLLRGNGTMINRIPITIARINTDVSIADVEANIRNLVMDIENAYWDLHFIYRNLETAKIGRDSAQATWNNVYEKVKGGIENAQAEAQSREQYFSFRALLEEALKDLYHTENRLRYLMGIAATDGRLIRPSDEPTAARINYDWRMIHTEALLRSIELRKQKWVIERGELQLAAAKNNLLPQLDVGAGYRWIGAGDNLINADRNGRNFTQDGSTAFDVLTEGDFQEASVFFNFQMPVGYRRELAGVRNAQLNLVREKSRLEDAELNLSHLLSVAVRDLDYYYQVAQTHFNRWKASQAEVDSVDALYRGGKTTLDLVLDAQRRRATGQIAYYKALSDYNKQIAFLHFRKGSLLEYNNIQLAEGPWADKAYWDALEHARERDASYYLDYGYTRPGVISQGPVAQGPVSEYIGDLPVEGANGSGGATEQIPTPAPTPAPMPAERPAPGDDAPQEPGPITTRPEGPMLNAPRRAETPRGSINVATRPGKAFEWGSLGLETPPASDGNSLRQASFAEPLRK